MWCCLRMSRRSCTASPRLPVVQDLGLTPVRPLPHRAADKLGNIVKANCPRPAAPFNQPIQGAQSTRQGKIDLCANTLAGMTINHTKNVSCAHPSSDRRKVRRPH